MHNDNIPSDSEIKSLYYHLRVVTNGTSEAEAHEYEVKLRLGAIMQEALLLARRKKWCGPVYHLTRDDYTKLDAKLDVLSGATLDAVNRLKEHNPHLQFSLEWEMRPDSLSRSLVLCMDWSQKEDSLLDRESSTEYPWHPDNDCGGR